MKKVTLILIATLGLSLNGLSQKGEFSNPSNVYGSNFGQFFVSMLRTQNYEMAFKFTAKESIKKHGAVKVKDLYKSFSYNYKLVQKSISKEGNKFTVLYTTNEMATGKLKTITLVVENDSCKVVLPENLKEFLK